MNCPHCQTESPGGTRFCLNCGMALFQLCHNCRTELPIQAQFCMNCGQPLSPSTPVDDARLRRLTAAAPPPLVEKVRASAHLAGERRLVTSLFVDVVGSTALTEQLDAEDWTTVMNGAFDRFYPVIYRYEGTIARLMGDALLAFFGAPAAHEDDPIRAVRAGLDLLAATREYAKDVHRKHGVEFKVRVGLNTGLVVIGPVGNDLRYDYTPVGDAVNLAARVQSAAQSMTVLITENTHRYVAALFDCKDLGWISIQGRAEPLRVYRVSGPTAPDGQLRGLAAVGLESPMVGRDAELATLLQLCGAVQAGLGRAVLILGEPGVGKTRLISEWKMAATGGRSERDLKWVEGHCLSYGLGLAYHLVIDLLRSLIGVPATATEPDAHAALLSLVADLVGAGDPNVLLAGAPEDPASLSALDIYPYLGHLLSLNLEEAALGRVRLLDPEALNAQYLVALRRLLGAMAARQPLVLVLEDVHWADPSSTELLSKLLPLASDVPLLICLVARPERDAPGWKLVSTAREVMGEGLAEIILSALSQKQSRQLLGHLLQTESLPEQVHSVFLDKAEGNPFFVEEMIRMLIEQGVIVSEEGRWIAGHQLGAMQIPDNLHGLLLARIDRLPEEAKHTLRVASVVGRQFSISVLGQVLEQEGDGLQLASHLNTLESAGLIRVAALEPDVEYRFRHALVQDAAYASMLPSHQKRMHRAVGETLERLYTVLPAPSELAPRLGQHFARAGDDQRARKYFALAGEAALASYANREAEAYHREALRLDPAEPQRVSLLSGLGDALFRQSRFEEAAAAWFEAISLCQTLRDSDGVAHLYARSARAAWYCDPRESLRLCQEGLAAVASAPESPGIALLLHEAARAYFFNGLPDQVRPLGQRALEMAERLELVDVQADALATLGMLEDQSPEVALDVLRKAVDLAESAGLTYQAARAHTNLAHALYDSVVDLGAARDHDRRAAELSSQRGSITGQLLGLGNVAHLSLLMGDLAEGEATLQEVRSLLAQVADPGTMAIHIYANEALLLRCHGELAEAVQFLRSCQMEARQSGDLEDLLSVSTDLADILLESCILSGALAATDWIAPSEVHVEVEAVLAEAIETAERAGWSSVLPRCQLSMLRASQKRLQDARGHLADARESAALQPSPFDEANLSWAETNVAVAESHWKKAFAAIEVAVRFYARVGMRWWWARALQGWAEICVARGEPTDLERAQTLFREANSAFEAMGASRYAALAENRLSALRAEAYARAERQQRVTRELATARRIQEGLLPEHVPEIPGWQLAVILEPAKETSGDFYDFISLSDGRWGIVVADVADKGAGAALYMALSRTLIRTYALQYPAQPERVLDEVNRRILADTQTEMFVTVFYGILDPETGTLTYCNAGHSPPYWLGAQARDGVSGAVQALRTTGGALGLIEGMIFEREVVQLDPRAVLLLYTDGVIDAQSVGGAMFGKERLLTQVQAGLGHPAHEVQEGLLAEIRKFVGDAPQFDDLTLMVVVRE